MRGRDLTELGFSCDSLKKSVSLLPPFFFQGTLMLGGQCVNICGLRHKRNAERFAVALDNSAAFCCLAFCLKAVVEPCRNERERIFLLQSFEEMKQGYGVRAAGKTDNNRIALTESSVKAICFFYLIEKSFKGSQRSINENISGLRCGRVVLDIHFGARCQRLKIAVFFSVGNVG